jgi:hypothetical protein
MPVIIQVSTKDTAAWLAQVGSHKVEKGFFVSLYECSTSEKHTIEAMGMCIEGCLTVSDMN